VALAVFLDTCLIRFLLSDLETRARDSLPLFVYLIVGLQTILMKSNSICLAAWHVVYPKPTLHVG